MSSFFTSHQTQQPIQGREDGPLRARCEVLATSKIGRYQSIQFVSPEIAERAEPGQFLTIGVEGHNTVLRRPFSIYSVSRHGNWAGTVEIIFDVVGQGTRWLASRQKGDLVDLVGPLGSPFPIPTQNVNCLLVGGGYGAAPLLFLATVLQRRGFRADMIVGARDADRLFNIIEVKRLSATTYLVTEDGSLGEKGLVTDVMERHLESGRIGLVYACGPMGMLRAVSEMAIDHNIPVRVAVEEAMACGTGVCWSCILPVERKGQIYNLRSCTEGPVFNGAKIQWDSIGAMPVQNNVKDGDS